MNSGLPCSLNRFAGQKGLPWWAILYLPFGLLLVLFRVLMAGIFALLAAAVPLPSWKNRIYKLTLLTSGLRVKKTGEVKNTGLPSVLVYNHVSLADALVIASIENTTIIAADPSANESSFNKHFFGAVIKSFDRHIIIINNLRTLLRDIQEWKKSPSPRILCVAPEGTIADGRGLFRFEKFFFSFDTDVIPVALRVNPAFSFNIHPLGASHAVNMFWVFAMPYVTVEMDIMETARRHDNETPSEFAERVRVSIANHVGAAPTEFSHADKVRGKFALKLYKLSSRKT